MIVVEHSAEALTACDSTNNTACCLVRLDDLMAQGLVRTFDMIMQHELPYGMSEVSLAERTM